MRERTKGIAREHKRERERTRAKKNERERSAGFHSVIARTTHKDCIRIQGQAGGDAGGGRAGGEPPRSERGERGPWDDEEAEKEEGSRQWQQADRRRRWEARWKPRLDGHMYLSSC